MNGTSQKSKQKIKKKSSADREFLQFLLAGATGGLLYYLALCLNIGTLVGEQHLILPFLSIALGAVGGIVPVLIEKLVGGHVPFFCSWTAAVFLLFIPIFTWYVVIQFFLYGYLFGLLWMARESGLPDF